MHGLRAAFGGFEERFDLYFVKKAPALPGWLKKFFVEITPYVVLIFFIIGLPLFLAFFGISIFLMPFKSFSGSINGVVQLVSLILTTVSLILLGSAIPALFKRKRLGWVLVYVSSFTGLINNLFSLNIFGLVILLILFYILFQIKSYYR